MPAPNNKAEEFFGQVFSTQYSNPQEEKQPSESPSKAFSFFGIDFGINRPSKPAGEPKSALPADSGVKSGILSFDTVFSNLIQAESGGKHVDEKGKLITSAAGAQGITQLLPKTAKNPGYGIDPAKDKSEEEYKRVGKEYLAKMYGKFEGDWEKALAAYNAGVGNVMKAIGKSERFGGDWKEHLPKKEETIPYIEKVLGKKNG